MFFGFGRRKVKETGIPVFIGGDGRSGTTLLSVILDSHSKLAVGPELHFNGPENLGPYVKECAQLLQVKHQSVFGKGLKENLHLKSGVQFAKRCHRFGIGFSDLIILIDAAMHDAGSDLVSFDDRCVLINLLGEKQRKDKGKSRWGMKIMRDIRSFSRYRKIWPNAKFIHIIRDGRDVAASQLVEHGTWGYGDIEKAANGWVKLISDSRNENNNDYYYEIRYEDIVADTENSLASLMQFLGESVEVSMMQHNEVEHTLFDNAYNHASINQVVKPINNSSMGRYKHDLSREQQEAFWHIAGTMLEELGYER